MYTKPAKSKLIKRSHYRAVHSPSMDFDPMGVGSCVPRVHWYVFWGLEWKGVFSDGSIAPRQRFKGFRYSGMVRVNSKKIKFELSNRGSREYSSCSIRIMLILCPRNTFALNCIFTRRDIVNQEQKLFLAELRCFC